MDRTRQYGKTLKEIRRDHVERYKFASDIILKGSTVIDLACGCGYGSKILKDSGLKVTGVDIEPEAVAYAKEHYPGPEYLCLPAGAVEGAFNAIVSLETLEHLECPGDVLGVPASLIIASVPNEEAMPFKAEKFQGDKYPHVRHYSPKEFDELLENHGFMVDERWCQKDKNGTISQGTDGIFLIYVAHR